MALGAELDLEAQPQGSHGPTVLLLVKMVKDLPPAHPQLSQGEFHSGDWSLVVGSENQIGSRSHHPASECQLLLIKVTSYRPILD